MDYSEKVMDHFANPRNCRPMEDADGVGQVGNPTCGDLMTIYIKVDDDKITDISFQTFGCGAAIATSSMITEIAVGKTLDEALKISMMTRDLLNLKDSEDFMDKVAEFDEFLYKNKYNPGTTADLTAASIFVSYLKSNFE